jgi:hypothetical protein
MILQIVCQNSGKVEKKRKRGRKLTIWREKRDDLPIPAYRTSYDASVIARFKAAHEQNRKRSVALDKDLANDVANKNSTSDASGSFSCI